MLIKKISQRKKAMINTPERTRGSLSKGQTLDMLKPSVCRLLLFLLPVLLPGISLRAQTAARLTLPDAVQIALKNNLGIQLAKNNVTIATIYNDYGVAGGLPYINGSAGDQEQAVSLRQVFANDSLNKTSNNAFSNSLTASLNGTLLLYNGERVVTAKKRLGTIETQAKQQLSSRALILINNVMLKYYDIVRQQSYARTLQRSIDATQQRLDIVKAQQNVKTIEDIYKSMGREVPK